MRSIIAFYAAIVLAGCSAEEAAAPEEPIASTAPSPPANDTTTGETETASLSEADLGRVCRTAIADLNGHDPSIVKINSNSGELVQVSYARPSDGKVWTNECRVEGDKVTWRTVDAFGEGSGTGRWRTDPMDEVVTFKLDGEQISITTTYADGSGGTATYSVS